MRRIGFLLPAVAVVLCACQQPAAPPGESPKAPPPQAAAAPPALKIQPALVVPKGVVLPSLDFPPGPLYVCTTSSGKTTIDYEPRVETLCRRHPEMGPCQYERTACRTKGGRVYTQKGEEITLAVEAEYDRIVMRVRFQGDSGAAPAKKK